MSEAMWLPKNLRVRVIREDIENSSCGMPTKCMYAFAIRREYNNVSYVRVEPYGVTITVGDQYYHFAIPGKGAKSLLSFDDEKKNLAANVDITLKLINITKVRTASPERKMQIMKAQKAREAVRPKRVYTKTLRARIAKGLSFAAKAKSK